MYCGTSKTQGFPLKTPKELECVIEMPYDVNLEDVDRKDIRIVNDLNDILKEDMPNE